MEKEIKIIYCVPCGYLGRAEQMKQALEAEGLAVALQEGDKGIFDIYAGEDLVFSRKQEEGRFPEPQEILDRLQG